MSSLVFYTAQNVADALGVHIKKVRQRFRAAEWPCRKIANQWVVTGEELEEIKRLYGIENMPVAEGTMEMLEKTLLGRLASYEENVQVKKNSSVKSAQENVAGILNDMKEGLYSSASIKAVDAVLDLAFLCTYQDQFELIKMLKTEVPLIVKHYTRKGGETDGE